MEPRTDFGCFAAADMAARGHVRHYGRNIMIYPRTT